MHPNGAGARLASSTTRTPASGPPRAAVTRRRPSRRDGRPAGRPGRRGCEPVAVAVGQFGGAGREAGRAARVLPDVADHPSGPGREADAEDRADVGVGLGTQHPLVEAAQRVQRLGEEHPLLEVGEGHRPTSVGGQVGKAGPEQAAGALVVGVEAAPGGTPRPVVRVDQLVDEPMRRQRQELLAGRLELAADPLDQGEADLVGQRERPGRIAGLKGGLLHRGGGNTLGDHADRLVDEPADHPAGEETPAVVDHDRGLADPPTQVERPRQRGVTGPFADHDLQQGHPVHRGEEVHADEVGRAVHPGGEPGDRQGGGVGGDQRVGRQHRQHLGEHGLLQRRVLEDRLDDRVASSEGVHLVGGGDPVQHRAGLRLRGAALTDLAGQQPFGVLPGPPGGLGRDVPDHDVQAGAGADVRDARAHHAGAEHRHPPHRRNVDGRSGGTTVDSLQIEEEGPDHVLGDLPGEQADQVPGLHGQGGLQVDLCAFDGGGQDRLGRGKPGTLELLAQGGREGGQLGGQRTAGRGATGHPVVRSVPRLPGMRVRGDPGPRAVQQLRLGGDHLVHDAGGQGIGRAHPSAGEQHSGQRTRQAEHPYRPGDTAGPGQQAQGHLGQPEPAVRRVQRDPVVTGKRDLQPAAERGAVDGRDHRPAQCLQAAQVPFDGAEQLRQRGRVLAGGPDHLRQVTAGEERRLRAGHDDSGHVVAFGLQPVEDRAHRGGVRPVHGVGGLVGVVQGERDDAVGAAVVPDGGDHLSFPRVSSARERWRRPCRHRCRGSPRRGAGRGAPTRPTRCRAASLRSRRADGRERSRRR